MRPTDPFPFATENCCEGGKIPYRGRGPLISSASFSAFPSLNASSSTRRHYIHHHCRKLAMYRPENSPQPGNRLARPHHRRRHPLNAQFTHNSKSKDLTKLCHSTEEGNNYGKRTSNVSHSSSSMIRPCLSRKTTPPLRASLMTESPFWKLD